MDIFSKFFFIAVTGLFLALFMLLVEHPNKKKIGFIVYGIVIILIVFNLSYAIIQFVALGAPFLILLDKKYLNLRKRVLYILIFFVLLFVFSIFILDVLPYYYYPILVFAYVLIAKKAFVISKC